MENNNNAVRQLQLVISGAANASRVFSTGDIVGVVAALIAVIIGPVVFVALLRTRRCDRARAGGCLRAIATLGERWPLPAESVVSQQFTSERLLDDESVDPHGCDDPTALPLVH